MQNVFPICFSSREDWERWRDSCRTKDRVPHCRDCLPQFQMRMKSAKRCAHPEVMFSVEDDGIVGLA